LIRAIRCIATDRFFIGKRPNYQRRPILAIEIGAFLHQSVSGAKAKCPDKMECWKFERGSSGNATTDEVLSVVLRPSDVVTVEGQARRDPAWGALGESGSEWTRTRDIIEHGFTARWMSSKATK